MTLSGLFSASRNKWWAKREAALRATYAAQEAALQAECARQEATLRASLDTRLQAVKREHDDVLALEQRYHDRQEELARLHEELRTQLRLLEAKAAPSEVWAAAFTAGFSKAWDLMVPLMQEGMARSYQAVLDEAAEQTLAGLEGVITQRLSEAKHARLRDANAILAKQAEFRKRQSAATTPEDKVRYANYVTCLDWVLQAIPVETNGH